MKPPVAGLTCQPQWLGNYHLECGKILCFWGEARGYVSNCHLWQRETSTAIRRMLFRRLNFSSWWKPSWVRTLKSQWWPLWSSFRWQSQQSCFVWMRSWGANLKGTLESKMDLSCVRKWPFHNTKKGTLTMRKCLVSRRRYKNERWVATPLQNSCTSLPGRHGIWRHLLVPSSIFISKDGLHCILKEPTDILGKFKELILNNDGTKFEIMLWNSWSRTHTSPGVSAQNSKMIHWPSFSFLIIILSPHNQGKFFKNTSSI